MRLSTTEKVRFSRLVGALAPLVLVVASYVFVDITGPNMVVAQSSDAVAMPVQGSLSAPTEAQRAALEHARKEATLRFGTSPFFVPDSPTRPVNESSPAAPPEEEQVEIPQMRVTSIISGGRQEIAVMNGTPRRIGEEVAPGWILVSIDNTRRSVIIGAADGRRVEVGIEMR